MNNIYLPFFAEILDIIKHTEIEYTFRLSFSGKVKPGQFFEVSLPKYGEAPISVSGIGKDYIDLTIRRVGVVTQELFNYKMGQKLFLRGPYGNGFEINNYKGKEVVVVAGGTGLASVKAVVEYFSQNPQDAQNFILIAGFKSPEFILFRKEMEYWEKNMELILTVDKATEGYAGKVGLVTEYIPSLKIKDINNAQVIVVGPPIMMKFAIKEFLNLGIREENLWVSFERKMSCGVGKCGHCKIDSTYICLDGPVFNYKEAKLLRD